MHCQGVKFWKATLRESKWIERTGRTPRKKTSREQSNSSAKNAPAIDLREVRLKVKKVIGNQAEELVKAVTDDAVKKSASATDEVRVRDDRLVPRKVQKTEKRPRTIRHWRKFCSHAWGFRTRLWRARTKGRSSGQRSSGNWRSRRGY